MLVLLTIANYKQLKHMNTTNGFKLFHAISRKNGKVDDIESGT